MREEMGNVCVLCKAKEDLEFDVIIPVGENSHHRKMSWDQRIRFYRKQRENNNLQLLCATCNGRKQDNLHQQPHLATEQDPF